MDKCIIYRIIDAPHKDELLEVWKALDGEFDTPLSQSVMDYEGFITKLSRFAVNIVCEVDGCIAGCVSYYANDYSKRRAYISVLAVAGTYRNLGIGSALIQQALCGSREAGMLDVMLEIRAGKNRAHLFYERHGFVDTSVSETGIYMVCDLARLEKSSDECL